MTAIEKPSFVKLTLGMAFSLSSAWTTNFLLGPDPNGSDFIWLIPGLAFGLALTLPNILDIAGLKWKIISVLALPLLMLAAWFVNMFVATAIGGGIGNLFGLRTGLITTGLISSLTTFALFNFYFMRSIKLGNYLIVALLGAVSLLVVDNMFLPKGQGLGNHLDKLFWVWQTLVGFGISLTFKKESLKVFASGEF